MNPSTVQARVLRTRRQDLTDVILGLCVGVPLAIAFFVASVLGYLVLFAGLAATGALRKVFRSHQTSSCGQCAHCSRCATEGTTR